MALENQKAECDEMLRDSLQSLMISKDEEAKIALSLLSQQKEMELSTALKEAEEVAKLQIVNLQSEFDASVTRNKIEIEKLQFDLTTVEARQTLILLFCITINDSDFILKV